jgi:hypothetical protein
VIQVVFAHVNVIFPGTGRRLGAFEMGVCSQLLIGVCGKSARAPRRCRRYRINESLIALSVLSFCLANIKHDLPLKTSKKIIDTVMPVHGLEHQRTRAEPPTVRQAAQV